MKRKFLAIIMGLILLVGQSAGCNLGVSYDEPPEAGTKAITIAIQDSGNGTEFLYDLKDAYEDLHPDTTINIVIDNTNLNQGDHPISNGGEILGYDIVYAENGFKDYQTYGDKLLDITDLGHLNLTCKDTNDTVDGGILKLNKYLEILHVHDTDGFEDLHLPPFMGNIDWIKVCKALKEVDYKGVFNFEIGGGYFNKFGEDFIQVGADYLYSTGKFLNRLMEEIK